MSLGSRGRRTSLGFALVVGIVSAGCRELPVRRPAATGGTAALPPLPVAAEPLVAHEHPAETPLLDAYSARVERARLELVSHEPPRPEPVVRAVDLEPEPPAPTPEPDVPDGVVALASYEVPAGPDEPPPAPRPPDPPAPVPVQSPAEAWEDGLGRLRELAREGARDGGDDGRAWEARARLLAWMAGSADERELPAAWGATLAALADGPGEAAPSTDRLRALARTLEGQAPLEILDLRFCLRVVGFGEYEPLDAGSLRAGQSVLLYCEVAGLGYAPDAGRFRSRLSTVVEVRPESGGAPAWTHPLGTADDACRQRRVDYFVPYRLTLPTDLAPGSYRLRLVQTDLIANRTASREVAFSIQP